MAAKLSIATYPEKVLKRKAGEAAATSEMRKLIPQMIQAMYENDGIGLAAPQIGISQRVIIVETSQDPRAHKEDRKSGTPGKPALPAGRPLAFLNPKILSKSKETETAEEGCLSLPGIFVPIKRAQNIEVLCQTSKGDSVKIEASGLVARIFQHEIDHLQGTLIIDHLTPVKRFKLRNQLREIAQQNKQ
ncbi:MAG TPA: peptide deformylase [Candidatus Paceibacterota bacterium]